MLCVGSDERSAAGGVTNIARSLGMAAAPLLLGYFSAAGERNPEGAMFSAPWYIAGGIKAAYDVILYALYLYDTKLRVREVDAPPSPAAPAPAPFAFSFKLEI